jgi:hypothetical protein
MNYTQAYKWLRAQGVAALEAKAALDVAAEDGTGTAWHGPRAADGTRAGIRVKYGDRDGYAYAGPVARPAAGGAR